MFVLSVIRQICNDRVGGGAIVPRQEQLCTVKERIRIDASGKRRPDEPSDQLRDVRMVDSRPEGHHHLSSRAVPTSRERLLEENHLRIFVGRDRLWIYPTYVDSSGIYCTFAVESMNERRRVKLLLRDRGLDTFNARSEIGSGITFSGRGVFYLYDQPWYDSSVRLMNGTVCGPIAGVSIPRPCGLL